MLTNKQYRQLEWEISRLYSKIESDLVTRVCIELTKNDGEIDIGNWRLRKLSGLGVMEQQIDTILSADAVIIKKDLESAIETAWNASNATDGRILDAIMKHRSEAVVVPVVASEIQKRRIAAVIANARDAINLTNTRAKEASIEMFRSAVNQSYLEVIEGTKTLSASVYSQARKIARSGIYVATYDSGSRYDISIDAAVRRNVVTSVARATAEQVITNTKEYGLDLVRTSSHAGARPEHFIWQGHIFSLSGESKKYPSLVDGTGYGSATGLCGCNCRHTFFPWVEGFEKTDTGIDLTAEENRELYEASQKQRQYERGVRSWKRTKQLADMEHNSNDSEKATSMIREYQSKLRNLCDMYDLPRQYQRERIVT